MKRKSKIIFPYKKSDGFIIACPIGCPNCTHCIDVFWDYSHGIYAVNCDIKDNPSGWCKSYENDGTEPITIDEYEEIKRREC